MPPLVHIKTTLARPPGTTVRQWRRIAKGSWRLVALTWMDRFFPLHFRTFSGAKYGYKRRTKKWLDKKRLDARAGRIPAENATIDNLYTGFLRESLEGMRFRIREYPTRVTLRASTPKYAPQNQTRTDQPDKITELLKIIPSERNTLHRRQVAYIEGEIIKGAKPQTFTAQG